MVSQDYVLEFQFLDLSLLCFRVLPFVLYKGFCICLKFLLRSFSTLQQCKPHILQGIKSKMIIYKPYIIICTCLMLLRVI